MSDHHVAVVDENGLVGMDSDVVVPHQPHHHPGEVVVVPPVTLLVGDDDDAQDEQFQAVAAAAAASTEYTGTAEEAIVGADVGGSNSNKWSKNGFGDPVTKQSGKFTKEESALVKQAVEDYCFAKQIKTERLCSECDHKAELKGAWMEIAKRLPNRSVQSVYRHGIRQLHPFKRGAWSEQECTQLQELVLRMGKKWAAIQSKLNRSADSCRDKYREMSDEYVKGRWKDGETDRLKTVIRESLVHFGVTKDHDMKELGRLVDAQNIQIPWSDISKQMGSRSRLSCFKKWQKMSGQAPEDAPKKNSSSSAEEPPSKRARLSPQQPRKPEHQAAAKPPYASAATAGAAAAMAAAAAAAAAATTNAAADVDFTAYTAKIAAETVEAVDLPDTDALGAVSGMGRVANEQMI